MQIIDGKKITAEIKAELKAKVAELKARGVEPGLATILVGEDPASKVYIGGKIKACNEMGIRSMHHHLPATATEPEIIELINKLNADPQVDGILLQLPLPKGTPSERALDTISPKKDVDGLHPYNLGRLCAAKNFYEIEKSRLLVSCTPLGVIYMLRKMNISISGKRVVIIGRSNLFGKPAAQLFLANDATVTMAHSRTKDLPAVCREADILVAAIGKPKFITKEYVKPGAVVLDVGINRTEAGIVGDVDFEAVKDMTSYITPVPGGVGATTITMLMRNTIIASESR